MNQPWIYMCSPSWSPSRLPLHPIPLGKGSVVKSWLFFFFPSLSFSLFIYFPFIFIFWRLVTLQYFSGFCHTLTWISHGFTCVPHPDPPPASLSIPSLWVFPVHQPWAPISCIQPGLVICFTLDSILVSLHWNKSWVLKSSFVWFFLHSAACSS